MLWWRLCLLITDFDGIVAHAPLLGSAGDALMGVPSGTMAWQCLFLGFPRGVEDLGSRCCQQPGGRSSVNNGAGVPLLKEVPKWSGGLG